MRQTTLILALLFLAGCSQPFIGIPGGLLTGDIKTPPVGWQNVPDTIQLETRPSNPYSINIWSVGVGSNLYVVTKDTNWMEFIRADANVRVRLGTELYELHALKVDVAAEIATVQKAYVEKYDFETSGDEAAEYTIYRLDRR